MAGKTPRRCVSIVRLGNCCLTRSVVHFMGHTSTDRREHRGARIGYTRISTVSQTLDQQNEALTAANVIKTFSDIMSGARDDRQGLAALMAYVRTGDTVVVWKLRQVRQKPVAHPSDRQETD